MPRDDQAAGLRRLFAAPAPRLLPVLVTDHALARWFAPLAAELARAGERTLTLDAARLQTTAAFGRRARFELAHVLAGECAPAQALIAAAPRLLVVPAARAFGGAQPPHTRLDELLLPLAACMPRGAAPDLVLVALTPAHAHLLAGLAAEVLLPLPAEPALLRSAIGLARSARDAGDIRSFRLLFPGMPAPSAGSLFDRLVAAVTRRVGAALHYAGPLVTTRELAHTARAAAGWDLTRLRWPELETAS